MANAIKTKEAGNVVAFDSSLFEADANQGLGQLGMDDLAIPFLRILSDTSTQIKKRDPQYIEGAESGMIYNTLTKEIFDGTLPEENMQNEVELRIKAGAIRSDFTKDGYNWLLITEWNVIGEQ